MYLIGALLDDSTTSLRRSFGERLPTALLITFLGALAFVPAQALRMYNHTLAVDQPPSAVWALMGFDGLRVGLLTALPGSALFFGYRAGLQVLGGDQPYYPEDPRVARLQRLRTA